MEVGAYKMSIGLCLDGLHVDFSKLESRYGPILEAHDLKW